MHSSPFISILLLLLLLYITSDFLFMYMCFMLPWTSQVVTLTTMYVQPMDQITHRPGDTFLNLHPANYGIFVCLVTVPRPLIFWQRDVGKTIIIQNGAYRGAQFTINIGKLYRYSIQPEFVPIVAGEPKAWLSTLLQDLKLISTLPQAKTTELNTIIQHLASSSSSSTSSEGSSSDSDSLIMTTTGKRYLTIDDIQDIKRIWEYITQAMQITYEMTGSGFNL